MKYVKTYVNRSSKEAGALQTMYLNPNQIKELIKVAGMGGVVLMQYYIAIAHQQNPNMEDEVLAGLLDMSAKNVETLRLKLTKAGWFRRTKFTSRGQTIITYDVGKSAVARETTCVKHLDL